MRALIDRASCLTDVEVGRDYVRVEAGRCGTLGDGVVEAALAMADVEEHAPCPRLVKRLRNLPLLVHDRAVEAVRVDITCVMIIR